MVVLMPGSSKDRSDSRKKWWAEHFRKNFNRADACNATGVNRSTLWRWIKEDKAFSEAVWEIEESVIDVAESKLMELVREGNLQAIKFLLRSKARERGYGDRLEIAQTVKNETIDVKRLEVLLADSETRNLLEKIAVESLGSDREDLRHDNLIEH
jgi:hypothetical protein